MELIIYSPQENQFVKEINFNFEDIKNELNLRLTKYEGLVYDNNSIGEAKTDRATLNKFKAALEDKRKEVKKQCLAPYEDFEKKVKELVALVDKPISAIDGQVKAFEQQKKGEKHNRIKEYYTEHIGELKQLLPLERIYDERWLNATYKDKDIYDSIDGAIAKVKADLKTISDLQTEYELQVKDMYLRTLDLSAALNEKTRLEQQKAKLQEYQQHQQAEVKQQEPAEVRPEPKQDVQEVSEQEPVMAIDFRVWATRRQLSDLKQYLKSNNIKFGRVE